MKNKKSKRHKPHIYKLTLLRDTVHHKKGEVYIGQTNGRNKQYWAGGVLPQKMAKKYGKDIFKREIIVSGDFNEALLNDLEIHYIRLYASQIKGLNLHPGGGSSSNASPPVYEYDLHGSYVKMYPSTREVADKYGCGTEAISAVCNGIRTSTRKMQYRYYRVDKIDPIPPRNIKRIPIYKYSFSGEYIGEFEYAQRVCDTHGGSVTEVHAACNVKNPNKSFKGFLWSYVKTDKIEPYNNLHIRDIHQYDISGNYIATFDMAPTAAAALGKKSGKITINAVMDKEGLTGYGFQWRTYKVENCGVLVSRKSKRVAHLDLSGKILREFESMTEASKAMNVPYHEVIRVCKGKKEHFEGHRLKFI